MSCKNVIKSNLVRDPGLAYLMIKEQLNQCHDRKNGQRNRVHINIYKLNIPKDTSLLIIREMQTEITLIYMSFLTYYVGKIQKLDNVLLARLWRKGQFIHCWWSVNWYHLYSGNWMTSIKLVHKKIVECIFFDPACLLPGFYFTEKFIPVWNDLCSNYPMLHCHKEQNIGNNPEILLIGSWGIWLSMKGQSSVPRKSSWGGSHKSSPPFKALVHHSSQIANIFHPGECFFAALLSSWPQFLQ